MTERNLRVKISIDFGSVKSDAAQAAQAFDQIGKEAEKSAARAQTSADRAGIAMASQAEKSTKAQQAAWQQGSTSQGDLTAKTEAYNKRSAASAEQLAISEVDATQRRIDAEERAAVAAEASSGRMGAAWVKAGKLMAVAVAAGAVIGGKAILDQTVDFESSLNTLGAVSHSSAGKMQEVSAVALKLGNDIQIPGASAADAAAAMTELAKGGLSVDEAMTAAKATLQLASAAQVDGARAATIEADALNTFGLKAKDASHVADVLANVANAATGDIDDFAQGMAQAGLVANGLGISVDDTATTLGIFAKNGLKGSDAGTSLKTMLVSLESPTKQQSAALGELGVKAFDASGHFVGMRTVTDELATAAAHMTDQQYAAATSTAFGTDAVRAATAIAAGGVTAYDAMSTAVGHMGGNSELATAQAAGLPGALSNVGNAVSNVALEIGTKYSPALADMLNSTAQALPAIGDFFMGTFDAIGNVMGAFTSLPGPVVAAVTALGAVALLKGPLDGLWKGIKSGAETAALSMMVAKDNAVAMGGGMAVASAGIKGIGTALKTAFLSNPIGIAIVAITTAIALFSDTTADAEAPTAAFASAVDDATGALKANAQALISKELAERGSLQTANALGITADTYTKAILGQPEALKSVEAALASATAAAEGLNDAQGDGLFKRDYVAEASAASAKFREDQAALAAQIEKTKAGIEGGGSELDTYAFQAMVAAGVADHLAASQKAVEVASAGVSLDGQAAALKAVGDEAGAADTRLQFLQLTLDKAAGRAPDMEAAQRAAAAAIRSYSEELLAQPEALRNVAAAQDAVTTAQMKVQEITDKVIDKDYTAEQQALDLSAANRDLADANDGVTIAQHGVQKAGAALADQGQLVYQSYLQQSQAAFDTAVANGDLAGAQEAARVKGEGLRQEFIASAIEAGKTKDEANALADQLGLIPEVTAAQIVSNSPEVESSVERLQRYLNAIDGTAYSATLTIAQLDSSARAIARSSYTGGNVAETMAAHGSSVAMRGFAGGGAIGGGNVPANPYVDNLLARDSTGKPLMVRGDEWVIKGPTSVALGPEVMSNINAGMYPRDFFESYNKRDNAQAATSFAGPSLTQGVIGGPSSGGMDARAVSDLVTAIIGGAGRTTQLAEHLTIENHTTDGTAGLSSALFRMGLL